MDIIDINVYETTETVAITVMPNLTTINVNSVTGVGLVTSVNSQVGDVVISTSDNNFTNVLKNKLDGIQAGAEVNVNADWNATSGDSFILNKPTIPTITIPTLQQVVEASSALNQNETFNGISIALDDSIYAVTTGLSVINNGNGSSIGISSENTNGTAIVGTSYNSPGVSATSYNQTAFEAYGQIGIFARGSQQAAILDGASDGISNIVEFQKNGSNQAHVTHDGKVFSKKVIINKSSDNNIDKLQVEGTASGSPATLSNQFVVKSQLDLKANTDSPSFTGTVVSTNLRIGDTYFTDGSIDVYNNNLSFYTHGTYSTIFENQGTGDFIFSGNGSEKMRITSSGNALIGTTTDNGVDKLQVSGSILATAIKKSGGLSTQYLMADGSTSNGGNQDINGKANTDSPTFTGTVVLPATTSIGTVSAAEIQYLDNVTSNIQTQLNDSKVGFTDLLGNFDGGAYNSYIAKDLSYMFCAAGVTTFQNVLRCQNIILTGATAYFQISNMIEFRTTAVAGSLGFIRGVNIGSIISRKFTTRFKILSLPSDGRFHIGASNIYSTAAPTNIPLTSMLNYIGVGIDSGGTNLVTIVNNASGGQSNGGVNTGLVARNVLYDLEIYSTNVVTVKIVDVFTPSNSYTFTTTQQNYTQPHYPVASITNNTTAAIHSFICSGFLSIYN